MSCAGRYRRETGARQGRGGRGLGCSVKGTTDRGEGCRMVAKKAKKTKDELDFPTASRVECLWP